MNNLCLPFSDGRKVKLIPLDEICYVEQRERKVSIFTLRGMETKYGKLSEYEPYLDERFVKVLKYTSVNFSNIMEMSDQTIYFANGETLNINREYFIRAKQRYALYLNDRNSFTAQARILSEGEGR